MSKREEERIKEFQVHSILKKQKYEIVEFKNITPLREFLRQSEENITVFSFCSTEAEKNKVYKKVG